MLKKTISIFIIFIFLFANLFSCSNSRLALLDYITSRDDKSYRDMIDKIFTALDNDDKKALKDLFAVNVIKSNPNIDSQIDALFEFYTGPKESDEGLHLGSSGSNNHGVKKISLFNGNGFIVTAAGVKYHVSMYMDSRNDENRDEEGIQLLELALEDAKDYNGFIKWHNPKKDGPGIYTQP